MMWKQSDAIALCAKIEEICPKYGCHVALTGGCLYKEGERKDLDILFYRIREASEIKIENMFDALAVIGFQHKSGFGWCYKATYEGNPVDCFFPEEYGGEYSSEEIAEVVDAKANILADFSGLDF